MVVYICRNPLSPDRLVHTVLPDGVSGGVHFHPSGPVVFGRPASRGPCPAVQAVPQAGPGGRFRQAWALAGQAGQDVEVT